MPYKQLAERLDALPNGFPATDDGAEIRLLEAIFTPEQAALAAQLRLTLETPAQIAERIGGDPKALRRTLKTMVRQGLIAAGRVTDGHGMGYGLLPFVVGIYEMQIDRIDAEMARRFEDYYRQAFASVMEVKPQVHRVLPVNQSIAVDIEIRPFESAAAIVDNSQAWGVVDCICRTQKALIGEACGHPLDVCMVLSDVPGAFDRSPTVQAQTHDEALATLQRAADAGLVHSVGNNQEGLWYICNCCTCSCGVLRGLAELGMADVVARSPFVSQVDDMQCTGCETCTEYCQFDALAMGADVMQVDVRRCVGCGVCVVHCPSEALTMSRRPQAEVTPVPVTEADWLAERATARGISLDDVL